MSVPITASEEAYTPACLRDIDDAPTFTFRDATVLDRKRFYRAAIAEGLVSHDQSAINGAIVSELRRMFESEGIDQNITKLEAYWQAQQEHRQALEEHRAHVIELLRDADGGDKPDLPLAPTLEFPQGDIPAIEEMIAEVRRHSSKVNVMFADNHWFGEMYPRLLLRMFLVKTDLPVPVRRKHDIITPECAETIINALADRAAALGATADEAVTDLLVKATLAFALSGDEEKNLSSPRSGTSVPKASAITPSTTTDTTSNGPATLEKANGSTSSASETPATP